MTAILVLVILAMLRYSIPNLYRVRATMNRTIKPSTAVLAKLKLLGLLKYRGVRAGINYRRPVRTIACRDSRSDYIQVRGNGVCKQNLVFPSVKPYRSITTEVITFIC